MCYTACVEGHKKDKKFTDPHWTADKSPRAFVELDQLTTLWFNTGTLCNLSCQNCYIESGPKNDRLVYLSVEDVRPFLDEIDQLSYPTQEIGLTGGEPFLNPHVIPIIELCLKRGLKVLVLTNGHRVLNTEKKRKLKQLNEQFPSLLTLRFSLDHYTQEVHERERGQGTFHSTLKCLKDVSSSGYVVSVAGRSLKKEEMRDVKEGYRGLFSSLHIPVNVDSSDEFVIFPEMSGHDNVVEITTDCWGILRKKPTEMMCSSSRMVIKRKGEETPKVVSCTLLAYDTQFEMGQTLATSEKRVYLNHRFCAQFCVLGGASCS